MALDRPPGDPLGPESIRAAATTIHPAFRGTPQFVHMRLVAEASLAEAQAELTAELGITVEGAAAASWASLLADTDPPDGAALVIVTGSNVAR